MRLYLWGLIVLGAVVLAQDNFYFSVSPQSVSGSEGQPATLRCAVSESAGVSYAWRLKGRPIHPSVRRFSTVSINSRGVPESQLRILRLDRERDAGDWSCIATNTSSGFSVTSRNAKLDVQWLAQGAEVQLRSPATASALASGSDVVLRCQVNGSGDISVDWFRNAERLAASDRIILDTLDLRLKAVTARDNGVYRCNASNSVGAVTSAGFPLAVPGDDWAHIQVPPKDLVVRHGDTARFDCKYAHADITEWYFKETGPLVNSSRMSILNNGSLVINSAGDYDPGLYACVGIRGESSEVPQKYTALLHLAYLKAMSYSSFEPELPTNRTLVVPEKTEFQINCKSPSGVPKPKLSWLDPRSNVIPSSGPVRVEDTTLLIESARPSEHAGDYTCVAENLAGKEFAFFTLVVSTPPKILKHPESTSVAEDEAILLSCQFSGMKFPITTVEWRKDDRKFSNNEGSRVQVNSANGTLSISSSQLSDRGNYTCVVNTSGFKPVVSKPATVRVKEKLKFTPSPVNKKMELGSTSKVNCKAQGSTTPVIRWIKEGDVQELPSHVQVSNGTMIFNGVQSSDKGRYTCLASNAEDHINTTITIDVHVPPKFSVLPKNFTEAIEGYPVLIDCAAEGDPKPLIQWDKNSNVNDFDQNRFRVMENGSLLIKEAYLSDQGKYGCTAGNSGGFKREEVTLFVRSAEGYLPNEPTEQDDKSMMTKTVVITLGAAAAYMFLVIGLMLWCRCRRQRKKRSYLAQEIAEGTSALLGKGDNPENGCAGAGSCGAELVDGGKRHSKASARLNGVSNHVQSNGQPRSDGENTAQSQSSTHSKKSKGSNYDSLSFSRADLQNLMLLGRGEMGEVYLAQARGLAGSTAPVQESADGVSNLGVVMVKALQRTRDEVALLEFRRQLDLFQRVNHPNVASLLGLCREQEPHYMLLQYTDWGDLKQFLLATREKSSRKSPQGAQPPKLPKPAPLTFAQITNLAEQAAQGMEHISNLRLVHKDVAARNCQIASGLRLKISLAGLSTDTYSREYFKYRNQILPLRWLPQEALCEDDFSTKSDVYAYGALVWEILTQAELPFHRKTDSEVLSAIQTQELVWKLPKNVPRAMNTLLNRCWANSPRDRPTFSQIVLAISEMRVDTQM